jgi:hypothetical protein
MTRAKVDLHLDHVRIRVKDATEEGLHALGLQVEGITKRNITVNDQVDTGFLLNSIYVESKKGSTFAQTWSSRPGASQTTKADRVVLTGEFAEVAVHVSAIYAIFQEMKNAFLRPAANEAAQQVGAVMEPVFKRVVRD